MYNFIIAILIVFDIWGIAIYRETVKAYDRETADLEYTIRTGEHCLNTCVEQFEKFGC